MLIEVRTYNSSHSDDGYRITFEMVRWSEEWGTVSGGLGATAIGSWDTPIHRLVTTTRPLDLRR